MAYRTKIAAKKSKPPLLRNAHLMAFQALLYKRGAPVDRYLRRHQLPRMCDDPNAFLPLLRIWSFFDDVARHEDSNIGWLVGAHVGDHNLNADLLIELESAPNLLTALYRLIMKVSTEATDIDVGIHERRDDVLLYTHYSGMRKAPGYNISQAYQLQILLDLIRHFLGPHWVPDEIGVESPLVPTIAEAHFPGCRVLTERPAGYIAVPRSCLHRGLPPLDAKVSNADYPLLSRNAPVLAHKFNYIDTLRALLKSYLSEGYPSERVAAELMSTSVRTLSRRLSTFDYTYGMLIDELRFNTAKNQLQGSNEQIRDIAHEVGFDDQGDFSRMIRRLGGMTPKQLRMVARGKDEITKQSLQTP